MQRLRGLVAPLFHEAPDTESGPARWRGWPMN